MSDPTYLRCGCEDGYDCTSTRLCHAQNLIDERLEDAADELERLTAELDDYRSACDAPELVYTRCKELMKENERLEAKVERLEAVVEAAENVRREGKAFMLQNPWRWNAEIPKGYITELDNKLAALQEHDDG